MTEKEDRAAKRKAAKEQLLSKWRDRPMGQAPFDYEKVERVREERFPDKVKAWLSIGNNKWYVLGGACSLFLMFALFGG